MALIEKKVKIGKKAISVFGYSRSSEITYFFIPSMKIQLDMGMMSKKFDNYSNFFLTHLHADHSVYLPSVMRAYENPSKVPKVFIPSESVKFVDTFLHSFQMMNDNRELSMKSFKSRKVYQLMPCNPTDEYSFGKSSQFCVNVLKCLHSVPCRAYAFFEVRKKLKDEYVGLPGKRLGELRRENVEISRSVKIPLFIFCGDTTIEFFSENEKFLLTHRFPVIFIECTFFDGGEKQRDRAHKKDHIHWLDLKTYAEKYDSTTFYLIHFSLKYRREEIIEFFQKEGLGNVVPWV